MSCTIIYWTLFQEFEEKNWFVLPLIKTGPSFRLMIVFHRLVATRSQIRFLVHHKTCSQSERPIIERAKIIRPSLKAIVAATCCVSSSRCEKSSICRKFCACEVVVFGHIVKFISPNCKINLTKFLNVFVLQAIVAARCCVYDSRCQKITICKELQGYCICWNWKQYLFKLQNVFLLRVISAATSCVSSGAERKVESVNGELRGCCQPSSFCVLPLLWPVSTFPHWFPKDLA